MASKSSWHYLKAAVVALSVSMLLAPSAALNGIDYRCEKLQESGIADPVQLPVEASVCYSPFHNKEYPLLASMTLGDLQSAMDADFSIMSKHFSTVRTYYSSFYGIPVAPIAAKYGMKLYLGVYMTDESWYADMVRDAVQAVKDHPETISAILVGNENISPAGAYSAADVKSRIIDLRAAVKAATGRTNIPIGTVQRSTEWLTGKSDMVALANACDIVGVNIYPFFDKSFSADNPALLLDGTWNAMINLYDYTKLRVTETGWPTAGTPVSVAPNNVPSIANSKTYYDAFTQWKPAAGGGEAFWFMFFDRAPYDTTMGYDIETYFGFYTWDKNPKVSNGYPYQLGTSAATAAPTATPSTPVATTATPAATTATPAATTATPAATTATPAATTVTPVATTTTPTATTVTPVVTTAAATTPSTTTATPASTTATPAATTATPASTTGTPSTTTATPAATTPAPSSAATTQRCNVRSN